MKTIIVTHGQKDIPVDLATEQVMFHSTSSGRMAIRIQSDTVTDTMTLKYDMFKNKIDDMSDWATATDNNGEDITLALAAGDTPTIQVVGNVTKGLIFGLSFTATSGTVNVSITSI